MIESGYAHFLAQRHRQLDDLSSVPEIRRAEHFLLRHLDPAIRSAGAVCCAAEDFRRKGP